VRIEAGRIRRALERYYLVAGTGDPVLITIPKGGYVPFFERQCAASPGDEHREVAAAPPVEAGRNWQWARALVFPATVLAIALLVVVLVPSMGPDPVTRTVAPKVVIAPFSEPGD